MNAPLVSNDLWEAIEPLLPERSSKTQGGRPASRIAPRSAASSLSCARAVPGGCCPRNWAAAAAGAELRPGMIRGRAAWRGRHVGPGTSRLILLDADGRVLPSRSTTPPWSGRGYPATDWLDAPVGAALRQAIPTSGGFRSCPRLAAALRGRLDCSLDRWYRQLSVMCSAKSAPGSWCPDPARVPGDKERERPASRLL